jgi:hypothetical protein
VFEIKEGDKELDSVKAYDRALAEEEETKNKDIEPVSSTLQPGSAEHGENQDSEEIQESAESQDAEAETITTKIDSKVCQNQEQLNSNVNNIQGVQSFNGTKEKTTTKSAFNKTATPSTACGFIPCATVLASWICLQKKDKIMSCCVEGRFNTAKPCSNWLPLCLNSKSVPKRGYGIVIGILACVGFGVSDCYWDYLDFGSMWSFSHEDSSVSKHVSDPNSKADPNVISGHGQVGANTLAKQHHEAELARQKQESQRQAEAEAARKQVGAEQKAAEQKEEKAAAEKAAAEQKAAEKKAAKEEAEIKEEKDQNKKKEKMKEKEGWQDLKCGEIIMIVI